jgi:hypothetical protein
VATHEQGEQHVGIVPHKEPYILPPDHRVRHQKAKVGITLGPDRTKRSTLSNTTASVSKPYFGQVLKM